MQWGAPEYAWLVLLLIPAFLCTRWAKRNRHYNLQQLGYCDGAKKTISPVVQIAYRGALFLLIIVALCRPQWGTEAELQESRGIDIIIALDTSRSMLADDLTPTRLEAAKRAITALARRLQGDRIGLIAFAGSAFPVCPLTSDYAAFRQVLDESGVDTIPYGGTDFSALTKEVMNAFAGTQTGSRLMILVSDGEDHGTSTATAAQKLRESGLTICGVTVGSDAGAVIPLPDGNFLKDRDDTIVRSRANPITLDLFSNRNLRLDSSGDALVRLVDDVRPLLLQSSTKSSRQRQSERFQIPLAAAVLLLVIDAFLTLRRQP